MAGYYRYNPNASSGIGAGILSALQAYSEAQGEKQRQSNLLAQQQEDKRRWEEENRRANLQQAILQNQARLQEEAATRQAAEDAAAAVPYGGNITPEIRDLLVKGGMGSRIKTENQWNGVPVPEGLGDQTITLQPSEQQQAAHLQLVEAQRRADNERRVQEALAKNPKMSPQERYNLFTAAGLPFPGLTPDEELQRQRQLEGARAANQLRILEREAELREPKKGTDYANMFAMDAYNKAITNNPDITPEQGIEVYKGAYNTYRQLQSDAQESQVNTLIDDAIQGAGSPINLIQQLNTPQGKRELVEIAGKMGVNPNLLIKKARERAWAQVPSPLLSSGPRDYVSAAQNVAPAQRATLPPIATRLNERKLSPIREIPR